MTALAKLGSPTSTSLTSRGRSITTDLPIPSGTNWELASLPTTLITAAPCSLGIAGAGTAAEPGAGAGVRTRASAAGARPVAASPNAVINATSRAVRISDMFPMIGPLIVTSFRRGRDGDAEPHHIDAAAAAVVVRARRVLQVKINQAAQRKRQRALLARERERLRLARAEL